MGLRAVGRRPSPGGGLRPGSSPARAVRPGRELAVGLRALGGGFWLAEGFRPGSGPTESWRGACELSGGGFCLAGAFGREAARRGADGGVADPRAAAIVWRGLAAGKRPGGELAMGLQALGRRLLSGGRISVGKRPGEGGAARRGAGDGLEGPRAAAFVWRRQGSWQYGVPVQTAGGWAQKERRRGGGRGRPVRPLRPRAPGSRSGWAGRPRVAFPVGNRSFCHTGKGAPPAAEGQVRFQGAGVGRKDPLHPTGRIRGFVAEKCNTSGCFTERIPKIYDLFINSGGCRRPAERPVFQKRSGRKPERSHPAPKDTPFATRE